MVHRSISKMEEQCVKNLSNVELQDEIRMLHLWMEKKGFQGIEPHKFDRNSSRLQDALMEKDRRIKENKNLIKEAHHNLQELGVELDIIY